MSTSMKPPNLQEWIERHGGYRPIPWDDWDREMAAYQAERRRHYDGRHVNIDAAIRSKQP